MRGGCRLVPHETYARKMPGGVRVRRFLCPKTRRTVSLLPDCLASHLPGTLDGFGAVLGSEAVLVSLWEVARDRRAYLPTPIGFLPRRNCVPAVKPLRSFGINALQTAMSNIS